MRIVHVVQGLGAGDQERLVVDLSHELARRGHDPAIVTLTLGGELRKEMRGVRGVPDIRVFDVPRAGGADLSLLGRLASLLHRQGAEVVHSHDPAPMLHAMPAALLARIGRRVHTRHDASRYGHRALWAARALVHTVHAVVAVSPQAADAARAKERVPERRLSVVPNGIPLRSFRPDAEASARIRAELGIAPDAFVVGGVGRLVEESDYPLLVRAVGHLLSERFRLVLVGEGDGRAAIERAIPPDRARYVTLPGARADVAALLASFDLFAVPAQATRAMRATRATGLPLAIAQAMACALPVVATTVGGLPNAVPATCGVLVRPGDEAGLAKSIARLARDRDRARAMGRAAHHYAAARFSIERTADAYESIYRDE